MTTRTEPAFDELADDHRRSELGEFLRIRRGKVQPEEVGMPSAGPRRTPGLRREEVAVLAAVGVTWYTWLEQGRPINPSEEVLASIARALRLSNDETDHVFILAGLRREVHGHPARRPHVTDMLRRLVEQQRPAAAFLMDARWDLVCWNDLAGALLGFDRVAADDRNVAWLMFADDGYGAILDDRERHARGLVAQLRLASGRLVGDDRFDRVLTRLRKDQPDFEPLWNLGEVKCRMDTEKRFLHPEAGPIEIDEAVLRPSSAPDLQLTILVPRPGSDERLGQLTP